MCCAFCVLCVSVFCIFFFKQKTAYEMRISDWSSDVCSSDLWQGARFLAAETAFNDWILRNFGPVFTISSVLFLALLAAIALSPFGRTTIGGPDAKRSEERRVGKECVSTCRSRWSPYH